MSPTVCSLLLKTYLTVLCGEVVMALSNYSLPFGVGSPFLPQGSPFGPAAQIGAPPPSPFTPSPSRTPYNPPTYLPPDNYRETDRGYNERTGSFYGNYNKDYNKEARQTDRGNIDYYGRKNDASTAPVTNSPSPRKGSDYRGFENEEQGYPGRPAGFTRVQSGTQGGQGNRAQLHAVLDYDEDYYEDEGDSGSRTDAGAGSGNRQAATPIQGPIFLKNGSVPVVPLYSYPVLSNGTFIQIPILWSALSVALGLEVRGQLIRGVPCIKRYQQLFCPTAGNSYPIDRIEHFIDENKALMKRMYGDFTIYTEYGLPPETAGGGRSRRGAPGVPDMFSEPESEETSRHKRQANDFNRNAGSSGPSSTSRSPPFLSNQGNSSGRIDACESKMEIVTPYWALNSAGKVRAVVNTMHFEQAIHQEVCSKTQTNRCAGDCGCEQKYKWHRLLAYDPDQDCAGIFMDWFLFPSCCVCRCIP